MKIILCLNHDIHAALALNLLFPALKNHQVKIILSQSVGKAVNLSDEIRELKKYEQGEMDKLFARLDNQASNPLLSRNQNSKFLTFNQIAQFFNHKINSYHNINSTEAITDIKNFAPDLIISIRFGQIFHEQIIKIPKHGIINLHSGILPKYRGIMPSFWAILNGEKEIGCTLHYIEDARIDYGSIISFSRQNVLRKHSFVFNVSTLYEEGYKMIAKFITQITKKENITTLDPTKLGDVNYFSTPLKIETEKFYKIMPFTTKKDVETIYKNWI